MKAKQPRPKSPRKPVAPVDERWIPGIKDAALKALLAERATANPGTAPSAKPRKKTGPVPGFVFMRPVFTDFDYIDDDDGDPDPDRPPRDPCAGQTWVWQPDLAVQLNTGEATCPSSADLKRIEQALGGHLSRFRLPDPEVRVQCTEGRIYIRVWGTRVQPNSCADQARRRAQVPDLVAGGNFGLYINAALIRRLAADAFQTAPKTYGANGAPSSSGPFHVTGLSVGFKSPDVIETYISGYDERPWPDVSFTQTIHDRLLALRAVETTTSTDFSVVAQIISALVLGIFAAAIPLLIPAVAFVLFIDIDAALNQPDNPSQGGVGGRMLQTLPDEIPLPQTGGIQPPIAYLARHLGAGALPDVGIHPEKQKLVIAYAAPTIDERGLFVGALASKQDRVPAIQIIGPSSLSMYSNASSTFGEYSVQADDTYGQLAIEWSGSNVEILNPGQARTRVKFRRGNAGQGDSFQRSVNVRVFDAEGTRLTASHAVTIYVSESGGLPPVCQVKPWLPQCNP